MTQLLVQAAAAPRLEEPKSPYTRDDTPTALTAECTCPGWCERDHDRD
jgi:hypothetical protein